MKHAATMVLVALAMVGCGSKQADPEAKVAQTPEAVFAVGALPQYNRSTGLGPDQGMCSIAFPPGPITKPGRFEAGCAGRGTSTFDAAVPTRLDVQVSMAGATLAAGETLDTLRAPFPLALAQPGSLGLLAVTFAADGRRLEGGLSPATWKLDPGCAKVVTSSDLARPDLMVSPVALGTCTLEVSYLGLKTTTSVVVR